MIGLLQRVSEACVSVSGSPVATIGAGILVFVAVEKTDTAAQAARLAERLCGYRVFGDATGRMNLSVLDAGGEMLLVPQFTLAADTGKGMRASFTGAADPADAERLFDELVARVRRQYPAALTGVFGAHMQIRLINDGPVTFWLRAA